MCVAGALMGGVEEGGCGCPISILYNVGTGMCRSDMCGVIMRETNG